MRGPHPNNETGHIGWRLLPFNGACFSLFGCFPSSGPGCARSTFPVGEGFLRRGVFISVRPGPVGVLSTPVPASPVHPLQAGEGGDSAGRKAGPPSPLERVFSKFPERNPLLLGTLMVEYPRWLWPAQLLYPRLSCGRKPKAVFHQTPYLADGKFMKRWKTQ